MNYKWRQTWDGNWNQEFVNDMVSSYIFCATYSTIPSAAFQRCKHTKTKQITVLFSHFLRVSRNYRVFFYRVLLFCIDLVEKTNKNKQTQTQEITKQCCREPFVLEEPIVWIMVIGSDMNNGYRIRYAWNNIHIVNNSPTQNRKSLKIWTDASYVVGIYLPMS